jgi:hypothetical protein
MNRIYNIGGNIKFKKLAEYLHICKYLTHPYYFFNNVKKHKYFEYPKINKQIFFGDYTVSLMLRTISLKINTMLSGVDTMLSRIDTMLSKVDTMLSGIDTMLSKVVGSRYNVINIG